MELTCVTRTAVRRCVRSRTSIPRREMTCRRHLNTTRMSAKGGSSSTAKPKPLPYRPTARSPRQQGKEEDAAGAAGPAPSTLGAVRWIGLFGLGASALCLGLFTSSTIYHWRTETPERWVPGQEPAVPTGRPNIQSPYEFDMHLDKSEWRFGITKLRRQIAAEARGHVLEVAVGTGRNLEFYDWGHITAGLVPAAEREAAAAAKSSSWWPWGKGDEAKAPGKGGEKGSIDGDKCKNAMLSYMGLDISPPMLDIALTRVRQVVPYMVDRIPKKPKFANLAVPSKANGGQDDDEMMLSLADDKLRILKTDAQSSLPAPPSSPHSGKYDTIIQTFGLCSVRDPLRLLETMASSLQPETGRIILLDHGRSYWELVNGLLDRSARGHFERFGCWWNRDLEAVVAAAERSIPGLEVVRFERPGWTTLGTHLLVELRVRADASPQATTATASGQGLKEAEPEQKTSSSSSNWWWPSMLTVQQKPSDDSKRE
ncbi:hypothetical protein F4779DRAFT_386434 [Xylariaceae sp. FL0662B]|nr:hypothetical protein F4779DRAFT_386434 [Xylariaceae sp. FL0662B]